MSKVGVIKEEFGTKHWENEEFRECCEGRNRVVHSSWKNQKKEKERSRGGVSLLPLNGEETGHLTCWVKTEKN